MTKVLVCGSVTYDTISVFPDKFTEHINLAQTNTLDMAFHVSELRQEYGGCAVNICYNLKLLGCDVAPIATVGDDFDRYEERLTNYKIPLDYIKRIRGAKTAHYFITIDNDENQIVVFHEGAMEDSHKNKIQSTPEIELGVIAPDSIMGMQQHADQFVEMDIPFIFDPGPTVHLLGRKELIKFVEQSSWVIMNNHEWNLFHEITGLTHGETAAQVNALIITRGSKGSEILTKLGSIELDAINIEKVKDPAGCGDAYRAGIIFGILNGFDWKTSGQIATLMGAINVEHDGAQNHYFSMNDFRDMYTKYFDETLSN